MSKRGPQVRARKALDKIDKMVREVTQWRGERPTIVRVRMADYLALTECGYVQEGRLNGTALEVKPG